MEQEHGGPMTLNRKLSRARGLRGWSQSIVASKIGTTRKNVSRWECGETFPSPYFRERLCQLFELDAEALGLVPSLADQHGAENRTVMAEPLCSISATQFSEGQGLVGREQLLHGLLQELRPGSILALTGLPGVGKTALLQELSLCPEIQERFSDGIIWVGLGPNPDLPRRLTCVARFLDLFPPALEQAFSADDCLPLLLQLLRETISTRHFLVILDDVWAVEAVLPFLITSPSVAYAISTRSPKIAITLASRVPYVIPPLSFQASHQLLTTLAPGIEAIDGKRLRQMIALTGGVPLAITLIGKYLACQSYGGQLRRAERALDHLSDHTYRLHLSISLPPVIGTYTQSTENPCSLDAAIAISDRHLPSAAQTVLRALSVLPKAPGSFSEEAALAVGATQQEVLDLLADAGLLEPAENNSYRMHPMIGDYASHHLEEKAPQIRLVEYIEKICIEHATDLAILDREYGTLLAGLDSAEALHMDDELIRCVLVVVPYMSRRGFSAQAALYLGKALNTASAQQDQLLYEKICSHSIGQLSPGLGE